MCYASAKARTHGVRELLPHDHGIPYSIVSDQGIYVIANEEW